MLAHRGIYVSYDMIHAWKVKFGLTIVANLSHRKQPSSPRWHIDEMMSTIAGERAWRWRAFHDVSEVAYMLRRAHRKWSLLLTASGRVVGGGAS